MPGCEETLTIFDTFDELANGSLNGQGEEQIGLCEWGTVWSSRKGKIEDEKLVFKSAASPLHATRYLSVLDDAASISFSAKVLDLCRVDDPEEPLNDNEGFCRGGGKYITLNLCSFDSYCASIGLVTQFETFLYRIGFFDDQYLPLPLPFISSHLFSSVYSFF